MKILLAFGILLVSYLVGSIPFGLILVRLKTGQDIRRVESGRTGATNVMRAAGFWMGLTTGILDILKSAAVVWLARWLLPDLFWIHVLAPLLAVLGLFDFPARKDFGWFFSPAGWSRWYASRGRHDGLVAAQYPDSFPCRFFYHLWGWLCLGGNFEHGDYYRNPLCHPRRFGSLTLGIYLLWSSGGSACADCLASQPPTTTQRHRTLCRLAAWKGWKT
jgi:hypothetical protein